MRESKLEELIHLILGFSDDDETSVFAACERGEHHFIFSRLFSRDDDDEEARAVEIVVFARL